jgi:hypothetical protein
VGGTEEGDTFGVGNHVLRDGGFVGHLDGVIVELPEGNRIQVVGVLGIV